TKMKESWKDFKLIVLDSKQFTQIGFSNDIDNEESRKLEYPVEKILEWKMKIE
ncbi:hypothetical protein L9F63_020852, partial [Diploptera punctata]